jgi:hypothetical protein
MRYIQIADNPDDGSGTGEEPEDTTAGDFHARLASKSTFRQGVAGQQNCLKMPLFGDVS